ncbi:MAG TPA: hypothetical protein VGP08_15630 [Pyrinomonadaceae bacterium]|jgi:hypothetical protein|nr:hypothetical protein [Pyrinomonadaceae bacterium]
MPRAMNPTPSPAPPTPHDVRAILENSRGTQFLRRLTDALGYDFACERLPTRGWPESARAG